MIKGIGHAGIAVSDMERSIKFYTEVLGFKLVRRFVRTLDGAHGADLATNPEQIGDIQLIYYPSKTLKENPGYAHYGQEHIGVLVDDVETIYKELKARGVTFTRELTPPRPGFPRVARFLDPDGVTIELVTFVAR